VRVSAQGLDHTRAGAESHILTASISGGQKAEKDLAESTKVNCLSRRDRGHACI
jgi:hypothetical protein